MLQNLELSLFNAIIAVFLNKYYLEEYKKLCVGNKFESGNTGTLLSNSMIRSLNFCCEGVTSARSPIPPETFVRMEA